MRPLPLPDSAGPGPGEFVFLPAFSAADNCLTLLALDQVGEPSAGARLFMGWVEQRCSPTQS